MHRRPQSNFEMKRIIGRNVGGSATDQAQHENSCPQAKDEKAQEQITDWQDMKQQAKGTTGSAGQAAWQ
jgi:hypothetical protein